MGNSMTLMGKFEDIDGTLRGQQWEIWRTLMGHFEAINGKIDDINGNFDGTNGALR